MHRNKKLQNQQLI